MVQAIMRYNSFNYIAHIGSFMCDFLKEIKIHLCSLKKTDIDNSKRQRCFVVYASSTMFVVRWMIRTNYKLYLRISLSNYVLESRYVSDKQVMSILWAVI